MMFVGVLLIGCGLLALGAPWQVVLGIGLITVGVGFLAVGLIP